MEYNSEDAIAVLSRTPKVLNVLLRGLPEPWTHNNEGDETWSPFDVLGHLIHGEETDWIERLKIILEHGTSQPFEPFDRFAQAEKSRGKTLDDLLDTFTQLRTANLATLRGLDLKPSALDLKGQHPALGPVTARQLLATWVAHDLGHIAQITRVMAKQYGGQVGPWKQYLGVLAPRSPG